jgi:hypothetical protein
VLRRGVALLVAVLAAGACGGGGDDDDSADGTMRAQLARIPGTPDYRQLTLVADHAAARAAFDLERLGTDASDDDVIDQLLELGLRAEIGFPALTDLEQTREQAAFRSELGFHAGSLDSVATSGVPPHTLEVYVGAIERDDVAAAVESDPVWSDELEDEEHLDLPYWAWLGSGEIDRERITVARPLGQSLRVAVVDDGVVLVTHTDEVIDDALEVAAGEGRSLADHDDLGPLADRIDAAGAIAALFTDEPWPIHDPAAVDEPLLPWVALTSAVALDDDGDPSLVVVLAHDDDAAAEENAARLEAIVDDGVSNQTRDPWSEILDAPTVTVDGRFVELRAGVEGGAARLWQQLVLVQDSLLATI